MDGRLTHDGAGRHGMVGSSVSSLQTRLTFKQTFPVASQYIGDRQESDDKIGGAPGTPTELTKIGNDTRSASRSPSDPEHFEAREDVASNSEVDARGAHLDLDSVALDEPGPRLSIDTEQPATPGGSRKRKSDRRTVENTQSKRRKDS
jgi:hypothetical protein